MMQKDCEQKEKTPLLLAPAYKDYLWGGQRLKSVFQKATDMSPLAESWELSCHPNGHSTILNGPWAGKTLAEYIDAYPEHVCPGHTAQFPLLVKLIDAERALSIQVHPDDQYAAEYGDMGKTEMWYVLDAARDAGIYYGFQQVVSKDMVEDAIAHQTLTELLHWVPVKKGDAVFIPAGTVHAIGAGLLIAEVQQSSDLTYRLYDYGRVGQNGLPRELHVEKALDVCQLQPPEHAILSDETEHERAKNYLRPLVSCEKFVVSEIGVAEYWQGMVSSESFQSLLCIEGEGRLIHPSGSYRVKSGQCFFLPADLGSFILEGQLQLLQISLPSRHT